MELRVLALAAPQYPRGAVHERVLNSRDPASLYNACRLAAARAESGLGPWGESNWADGRQARRDTVLLLETAEHGLSRLQEVLLNLRPNLVLIGSMTICFPGAIACARLVRETLGDTVCIVLGGRHVSETIYANRGEIHHHAASPLKLIQQSLIPNLFDFIAAGDGEGLIAEIGEIIGRSRDIKSAVRKIRMGKAISAASGQWILGWADNGRIETISGTGAALDYNKLPAPCEMFGVSSSFEVFEGRPTAHVFSDIGPGCVYSCSFCSEAARVAGK
ncbi:MAG: hypothetical protein DCC75_10760, partial [Proteobacteria bacterium]